MEVAKNQQLSCDKVELTFFLLSHIRNHTIEDG